MKFISSIALSILVLLVMSGCTFTNEGNFQVVKNWDKTYQDKPVYGFEVLVFDSATEVYGRERLLQILDARPKDSENVMLKDLDLSVSYRINPDKAIDFLRERGDIKTANDLPSGIYVIGETYVHKDAKSIIGETVRKFTSEQILNEKKRIEEQFKVDLQEELDNLYGKGTFIVNEVKIANVMVADSIEERIQAVALINAEKVRADATKKILDTRLEIQTMEMGVIAKVAQNSGLSIDQVLEARRLEVIGNMQTGGASLMINTDKAQ